MLLRVIIESELPPGHYHQSRGGDYAIPFIKIEL